MYHEVAEVDAEAPLTTCASTRYGFGRRFTMPTVHHARRELHLKVVYYGPGLGGKTTNLEWIHANSRPSHRGKLVALNTEAERTLFFDLLPMDLGEYRGYRVRLHLCTVPGQIALDATRRLVLRHVDAVVFVVDSQPSRVDDNVESIINLDTNLRLQGDDPDVLPLVVQYNKRDLPHAMSVAALRSELRVPRGVTEIEASAVTGLGVLQTLRAATRESLKLVGDPNGLLEGRSPSILPGRRPSMYPGAVPPLAALLEKIPGAPRVPNLEDVEG